MNETEEAALRQAKEPAETSANPSDDPFIPASRLLARIQSETAITKEAARRSVRHSVRRSAYDV